MDRNLEKESGYYVGDVVVLPSALASTHFRRRNYIPKVPPKIWVIIQVYLSRRANCISFVVSPKLKNGTPSKNDRLFRYRTLRQLKAMDVKVFEKHPKVYRCPDCGLDDDYSLLEAPLIPLAKIHDHEYFRCKMCGEQYITWDYKEFSPPAERI